MEVSLTGPALAVQTCARRLSAFGASDRQFVGGGPDARELSMRLGRGGGEELRAGVSWHGTSTLTRGRAASEATVQAMCGLMEVHGRDAGQPRRLGLEVASVASGVLAAQAVLAALVARSRGRPVSAVDTSVLEAGLVLASHYVAEATCPDPDDWTPPEGGPDPGPPFRSVDGCWFEIETLDPGAWRRFWSSLGAADADLGRAWTAFRARYFRGKCSLPPGLHQATARHRLDQIAAAAAACEVSLAPLRSYAEVLAGGESAGCLPLLSELEGAPPDPSVTVPPVREGLPLEGIEVVEATSRMQGPLAGLLLQMLGAHVLRVEPPGGDPIRLVPPYAGDDGYFFTCFNRGKDSVELDLAAASDRATLVELAAGADVFLHNWRPGKAAEWGVDPEALAARNPRLIYVHASGWGDAGPDRRPLGTDFLVQAHAGMGHGLNPEGEPPASSRVLLTDCLGALVTCEGALGGLYRREQTGRGCRVDASLLAGGMTLQAHVLDALRAGRETSRLQGRPLWGPLNRPLRTADGYVVADVAGDGEAFARLSRLCDVDPGDAPRFETETAIADRVRTGPATWWEEVLCEAGIPCAVVCSDPGKLPEDPDLGPLFEGVGGGCRAPAAPWRFACS